MEIYFFYFHEILKLALFHVLVKFLFRQFKTFAGKLKIFSKLNYYFEKTLSFLKTQFFKKRNSAFCFEKKTFFQDDYLFFNLRFVLKNYFFSENSTFFFKKSGVFLKKKSTFF